MRAKGTIYKKITALIVGLSLLVSSVSVADFPSRAENSVPNSGSSSASKLEKITLSDAGISYGNMAAKGYKGEFNRADLNGTLFSMYMISGGNGAAFVYGQAAYGAIQTSGLAFSMETDGRLAVLFPKSNTWEYMNATDFGMKGDFATEEFLLQISTEFGDFDGEDDAKDVKLGIFINGKQWGEYSYVYDDVSCMGTKLQFMWGTAKSCRSCSYETVPTDLEEISLIHAGISDKYKDAYSITGNFDRSNLGGTVFSMYLQSNATGAQLNYGTANLGDSLSGIALSMASDDEIWILIGKEAMVWNAVSATSVGLQNTFKDQEVLLQITTRFGDFDGEGDADDTQIGIFINGRLCNGDYHYVYDDTSWLGTGIQSHYGIPLQNYRSYMKTGSRLDDFENKWTIKDLGLEDSEYIGKHTFLSTGSYADSVFSANLGIDTASRFVLGDYDAMNGFLFDSTPEGMLYFYCYSNGTQCLQTEFKADIAKTQLVSNDDLRLDVTVEAIGSKAIRVGVYFDYVLYNGRYLYIAVEPDSLQKGVGMETWLAQRLKLKVPVDFIETPLTELTASDLGLEGQSFVNETKFMTYQDSSINATALTMVMTFPNDKDSKLYFGGQECGVRMQAAGDQTIKLTYLDSAGKETEIAVLSAEKAKVSELTDKELRWRFTFRTREMDAGRGKLQLGIFINGQLYEGAYFVIPNVEISTLKQIFMLDTKEGQINFGKYEMEELTLHDFSILDMDEQVQEGENLIKYNYCDLASFDATAVSMVLNFSEKYDNRVYLGGTIWEGLLLYSPQDDDSLKVTFVNTDGTLKEIATLTAEQCGRRAMTGEDVKIRFEFEVLKTADGLADLKLGIFVDDKLYNNAYCMVKDVDFAQLTRTCTISASGGHYRIQSVEDIVDFTIYGYDNNWKKTLGLR